MPSDSTLTLFIPDLFAFQPTLSKLSGEERSQLPEFKLARLEKWLSRGLWQEASEQTEVVFEELGLNQYINKQKPYAAFSLLTENMAEKANCIDTFWLRADPVNLQADRDTALLVAYEELSLTENEAESLVEQINTHFKEEPWQLYAFSPHRWYLKLEQPVDLVTTPLEKVLGQDINQFVATGSDADYWFKIINEMQMLLHGSNVNFERDSRNMYTANSLWLWGEGRLDENTCTSDYHSIVTASRAFKGIGYYCDVNVSSLSKECIVNIDSGSHMIILDMLSPYVQHRDLYSFVLALNEMVENYIEPCNEFLMSGKFNKLKVITDKGKIIVNKKLLRRWWKRRKSFLSY